jgi:heterodisulfide reductase subunit A-like polyferredoxin
MQAWQRGTPMLASSGYLSQVRADLCQSCGQCVDACQFGALSVSDGTVHVDPSLCMGCGVCTSVCPEHALSLRPDPCKGTPLVIRELIQSAGFSAASERASE